MRNKNDHNQLNNKKILIYFHARFRYYIIMIYYRVKEGKLSGRPAIGIDG
jgi:hypothetical protein